MSITFQVWLKASLEKDGSVAFKAASDSQITRGLCSVLIKALSDLTPEQILEVSPMSLPCVLALQCGINSICLRLPSAMS